jgi:hypothetical protein
MIKLIRFFVCSSLFLLLCSWGFYAHKSINKHAVYALPSEMNQQYSLEYILDYIDMLNGMVEKRMKRAVFATASFWCSAWVDAGQPDLMKLKNVNATDKLKKTNNYTKENA